MLRSHTSVLQIGNIESSDDVIGKPAHEAPSTRPTPLDFVRFLPYLCSEWESPQLVNVTREVQDDYVSVIQDAHSSKSRFKMGSKLKSKRKEAAPKTIVEDNDSLIGGNIISQSSFVEVPLVIKAIYDTKSHLVEVAITNQLDEIQRKTLQAISVCIPYHSFLTRLTLRWVKLNYMHIHEIIKFLPDSYLTDVVLDDTVGCHNYDELLSKKSTLLYLSLNRCRINDDQCKKIAANIGFGTGGENLKILELGSNFITDVGAIAIAESLRRNRNLNHLNLSGNMITDDGAVSILSHLMKFQLRQDEIMETKKRKRLYLQKKQKIYETCRDVVMGRDILKKKGKPLKSDYKNFNKKQRRKTSTSFDDLKDIDCDDFLELSKPRVEIFVDPFDKCFTITENEWTYCTGNVVLCSLNLAYNNLSYHSIQKIHEVLKYQNEMMDAEGLKRVVFSGNQLPVDCELYSEITTYLLNTFTVLKKPEAKGRKAIKPMKPFK